jgi:hypothetical protein
LIIKTNQLSLFVTNLNHHGFGFLLHEDLDKIQLDLLMIASWSILQSLHAKTDQFPNKDTIDVLSNHQDTQAMFASVLPSEDGGEIAKPTFLEATCKGQLPCLSPCQEIDFSKREIEGSIEYQYSLIIPGCVPKHRRKHPLINGTGYSGVILSDAYFPCLCWVHVVLSCMVSWFTPALYRATARLWLDWPWVQDARAVLWQHPVQRWRHLWYWHLWKSHPIAQQPESLLLWWPNAVQHSNGWAWSQALGKGHVTNGT